jgi:WD40 repeat protein
MNLPESTQQNTRIWRELSQHTDSVTDAAWSPNGDFIASIGRDRRLTISRISTNTTVHQHAFDFPLMHGEFLTDDILVLCDFASNLRSYAWADGKVVHTLSVNVERASTMRLAPAIRTIALGYKTGLVEFVEYRAERGALTTKTLPVGGPVWQIEWSSSGDTLYVSTTRDGITVYDPREQNIIAKFPAAGPFAISEQSNLIATFQRDSSIHVYRLDRGKRVASLEGSASKFGKITFTEDGQFLIAKTVNGGCFIWSVNNWQLISVVNETVIYPRFPLIASPLNPLLFISTGSMQKSLVIREVSEPDIPEIPGSPNPQYRNCKVVIMEEQGVGKSALRISYLEKVGGLPIPRTAGR